MRTVLSMLKDAAQNYTDLPYLSEKIGSGWQAKSFAQADEESDYFGAFFIDKGWSRGDNIALLAEGRQNWVIGEYGLLKAGCTSVPLSIQLLPEEVAFRLNHSESKAIIISENVAEKLIPILDELTVKPLIVYLNDPKAKLTQILAKYNKTWDDINLITADDAVARGKELLAANPKLVEERLADVKEDDVVTISYTSGTTGNPKGIMLTHLNYWGNSNDAAKFFNIPSGESTLIILPLDHSFAHTVGIYICAIKGVNLCFADARGGSMNMLKNIPSNLVEVNPYFLLTVPALSGNFMKKMKKGVAAKSAFLNRLFLNGLNAGIAIHKDGYRKAPFGVRLAKGIPYGIAKILIFPKLRKIFGERIKFCVGGGALLEIKQQEFFNAIGVPIFQGYGLTEATPIICANSPNSYKFGTSGKVLDGVTCRIMANETEECPVGVTGEIVIKGLNVMKGYYKNEEATVEMIKGEWLWTGDLGYYDKDNFLVVVGREKALLISANGEKYSSEAIEEVIVNNSSVINQLMVYNEQSPYTTAVITLDTDAVSALIKEKGLKTANAVLKAVHDDFFAFKKKDHDLQSMWIPSSFEIIEEPFSIANTMVNSTMKLVRYKVREHYKERIASMYEKEYDFYNENNRQVVKHLFKLES